MVVRGVSAEEAAQLVDDEMHRNGFKRLNGPGSEFFIEGRRVKAAIKEAGSVAVAAGKLKKVGWGKTNKGIKSFLAEHVFVIEDNIPLGVMGDAFADPENDQADVMQRFVHTFRGNAIQYEEYVKDVEIEFTVVTDQDLTEKEWGMIWLTGEQQGIGATRSQGFGRYEVVGWEPA
jgi:hypothetical protein